MVIYFIILIIVIGALGFFMVKHLTNVINKKFVYDNGIVKSTVKNGVEIIQFSQDHMKKGGLPVIPLKFNGLTYNFLIDSGANINVLDRRVFEEVNKDKTISLREGTTITTGGGVSEEVGQKADITFKYKNRKFEEIFDILDVSVAFDNIQLVDGVTLHGILGTHFFNKHRWILDFENMVVWIK